MLVTMRMGTLVRIVTGVAVTTFIATIILLNSFTADRPTQPAPAPETRVTGSVSA